MKMNRKGALSDFAADIFSFLAYALILIVFMFLFTAGRGCEGPVRQSISGNIGTGYLLEERQTLLNYVRTPVSQDNAKNVAELAALAYIADDDTGLKENAENFLNDVYPYGCAAICVRYGNLPEENPPFKYVYKSKCPGYIDIGTGSCTTSVRLYIPINDNSETVAEIRLNSDAGREPAADLERG